MKQHAWTRWARAFKDYTYALHLASRDPRVPPAAKLIIVVIAAYALSPIDLIPDFIPIIGYLDDLLLLPLAIALAIRLIPEGVWAECRVAAAARRSELPRRRRGAAIVIGIWVLIIVGLMLWVWPSAIGLNDTTP